MAWNHGKRSRRAFEVEDIEQGEARKPVAKYVLDRDDGEYWEEWLQTHRVELNAMTTPEFIEWLDNKMAEHEDGKLIPPPKVLTAELDEKLEAKVRAIHTERILREAGLKTQIAETIGAITRPNGADLAKGIDSLFARTPETEWRTHIDAIVDDLTTRIPKGN